MKTAYFEKGSFLVVPNKEVVLKLRGATLNVYLAVVDHADNSGECFPSYKRLCEATGYKERQCVNAVNGLEKIGLLKRTGQVRDDGSQRSNKYRLTIIHMGVHSSASPPLHSSAPHGVHSSAPHELTVVNSTYKELKERGSNKFDKRSYALACRADEAQAERARAARHRKGSTKSLEELFLAVRAEVA